MRNLPVIRPPPKNRQQNVSGEERQKSNHQQGHNISLR